MKIHYLVFLFMISLFACGQNKTLVQKNVGDIAFDAERDDPAFEVCNEQKITQYYVRGSSDKPAHYAGEKKSYR